MSGKPWMVNSMAGGGPTLSSNGGVGSYNPASNLASVLASGMQMGAGQPSWVNSGGMQGNPAMADGGMRMGGGPLASERYGYQKPSGGKPSIGTAGGGGKPNIGYGGGGPSRAMWK